MLTSKAIFLWISYQKKNMGYLHIILWKKMFCGKKVTKLPDLTVHVYYAVYIQTSLPFNFFSLCVAITYNFFTHIILRLLTINTDKYFTVWSAHARKSKRAQWSLYVLLGAPIMAYWSGAQSWINRAKGGGEREGGGPVASSFLILEYVDMYRVQHILHTVYFTSGCIPGCEDSFLFLFFLLYVSFIVFYWAEMFAFLSSEFDNIFSSGFY
jgi:hypothetical protein